MSAKVNGPSPDGTRRLTRSAAVKQVVEQVQRDIHDGVALPHVGAETILETYVRHCGQ